MKNNSGDSLSNTSLKAESISQEKDDVSAGGGEEAEAWYNKLSIVEVLTLLISLISMFISYRVRSKSNKLSTDVKKLEIKMRTSDIIVAKRLEVFPKLHVLTDTLGAAIRYYNNHKSVQEKKEWNTLVLKREIKTFHHKLSDWDANYCIFAGYSLTQKVGEVRKFLEKNDDWDKKEITPKEIHDLHFGLWEIEQGLKKEMKIHFTEDEENIESDVKESLVKGIKKLIKG
jgi:hypothetical protein